MRSLQKTEVTFYEYCQNTGKDNYFQLCEWRLINKSYPEYPNPLALLHLLIITIAGTVCSWHLSIQKRKIQILVYKTIGFINPDILAHGKLSLYTARTGTS